jgi:hypothetical protein
MDLKEERESSDFSGREKKSLLKSISLDFSGKERKKSVEIDFKKLKSELTLILATKMSILMLMISIRCEESNQGIIFPSSFLG